MKPIYTQIFYFFLECICRCANFLAFSRTCLFCVSYPFPMMIILFLDRWIVFKIIINCITYSSVIQPFYSKAPFTNNKVLFEHLASKLINENIDILYYLSNRNLSLKFLWWFLFGLRKISLCSVDNCFCCCHPFRVHLKFIVAHTHTA